MPNLHFASLQKIQLTGIIVAVLQLVGHLHLMVSFEVLCFWFSDVMVFWTSYLVKSLSKFDNFTCFMSLEIIIWCMKLLEYEKNCSKVWFRLLGCMFLRMFTKIHAHSGNLEWLRAGMIEFRFLFFLSFVSQGFWVVFASGGLAIFFVPSSNTWSNLRMGLHNCLYILVLMELLWLFLRESWAQQQL